MAGSDLRFGDRLRLKEALQGLEVASTLLSNAAHGIIPGPLNQERLDVAVRAIGAINMDDLDPEVSDILLVLGEFLGRVGMGYKLKLDMNK